MCTVVTPFRFFLGLQAWRLTARLPKPITHGAERVKVHWGVLGMPHIEFVCSANADANHVLFSSALRRAGLTGLIAHRYPRVFGSRSPSSDAIQRSFSCAAL